MRRADRLFRVVQLLRRRKLTTAARLAEELEVSERTIYRDVADLVASGVPIAGEAGVGYALDKSFDLPPLMFDGDELEALVLGARVVEAWAGPELARAARRVLAKVETVLPERLRRDVDATPLLVPDFHVPRGQAQELDPLRQAIRDRRKVQLDYVDRAQAATARTIRPLGLVFWGQHWMLAAWCELRRDFRGFRLDRVRRVEVLPERFIDEPGRALTDYLARANAELPPDA
jgi:predicted DNA-binding transcriptional regulator YafY